MIKLFHAFWRDESGAMLPVLALAFLSVLGSVGVAFDTGRAQLVQAKLSSALDAAGLAAGTTMNTNDINTEVNKYLRANYPQGYLDSTITNVTTTTGVNESNDQVITLHAEAQVPSTFMGVFGFEETTVEADSEITRRNMGLELVMVLDNTGSMAGTKLTALKTAANDLIDILYGSRETVDDLWVGLVPFSQAVNIGSSRTAWLDGTTFNWGPGSWGGCVDARSGGRDVTDDPPSTALFRAYYWPDHSSYNDWIRDDGTYRTPLSTSRGPNKNCPAAVTAMTASKTTIINAIAAMQATGNTHVNLGAVWGWRMLSPRWRGLWGGEMNSNNLPLDYNSDNMNKAVVIMTDGENTHSNSSRSAYGYLSDGTLGTTSSSTAVTRLNTRLSQVCTAMKNNNIFVYTIAFGSPGTTIQNLLRSCATQPDFYFDTPSEADLNAAFRSIGDSLTNLRVSK